MSDALGQFIGDVRDIFVTAERDKVIARDPHAAPKPPAQKPQVQTATGTRRPFLDWLAVCYVEIDKIERGG